MLLDTERKERDSYLNWTLNCPVDVFQGKRGPFISTTGQNTDTRAQKQECREL